MARVTLEILGETIFSDGLERDPAEFLDAMSHFFATVGSLGLADLLDFPDWVPRLAKAAQPLVHDLLRIRRGRDHRPPQGAHRERRKRARRPPHPAPAARRIRKRARGLTDLEVKANIITFIAAGHETTANALTWALFLLSLSPHWSERVAVEADRVLERPPGEWAERLVEDPRRPRGDDAALSRPSASLSREAIGPDDLCGRRIRKGALVIIAPYVLHRHKLLWEQPRAIRPQSFPARHARGHRPLCLPALSAPDRASASARPFRLQEATIVLATLMRQFEVIPVRGHRVEPVQRITLRPKSGMPLIVRPRRAG